MTPEAIFGLLKEQFDKGMPDTVTSAGRPYAVIDSAAWPGVAQFLRDDSRLQFNLLRSISAIDLLAENQLACVYDLLHIDLSSPTSLITTTREFAVRVLTPRDDAHIPTVSHIWPTANWHEREAYDMMGIVFDGHPDPRRILCPDDWVGYPLRKDYEFPLSYDGIPGTTEYELTNPRH